MELSCDDTAAKAVPYKKIIYILLNIKCKISNNNNKKPFHGEGINNFLEPNINYLTQGCSLRKITRIPKVPNYEVQGNQHN